MKKGKKKVKKNVQSGIAHVQSTFNNTHITITDVAGNIEAFTKPLGEMISDEDGLGRFKQAFDTVSKLTESIDRELFGKDNRFKLLIDNMEEASNNIKTFSTETLPQIQDTFARLDKISTQIEAGQGTLGKLIYEEELYADVKEALSGLKEMRLLCRNYAH